MKNGGWIKNKIQRNDNSGFNSCCPCFVDRKAADRNSIAFKTRQGGSTN